MTKIMNTLRELKVLQGPFLPFNMEDVPDDPKDLFLHWLEIAIAQGVPEPHAMTLSTADADGFPDARVLILKNLDHAGFHFAISSASRKGRQLSVRPQAALTFYWQKLARQVRVRGPVVDLGPKVGGADFAARPVGSRAAAMLGRQSEVLSEDAELDAALAESLRRVEAEPAAVSDLWRVYAVRIDEIEFWQGAASRRHERLRYRREGDAFHRERLWP
ncbi:pyridoxine/pyridoxamine 5'-phosphate oxidase [Methylocystis parvus]|uniref:Pyridoxamine 5'-phosphate oxidase n=1 Tax=Methylocystis parvus TaxID=134 RepID=A0A6B8M627_9HYPH|nr:pyridoxal 5'-phosphate synthase [Methylocystis parvus]QGM98341.1 pyridoxamine 5'-phosphate oxidase [Methylocystis parvus]WBK01331.1 pyridoxal 5'-phosphate synthase [Methylocystis parvus OBBP]